MLIPRSILMLSKESAEKVVAPQQIFHSQKQLPLLAMCAWIWRLPISDRKMERDIYTSLAIFEEYGMNLFNI